MIIDKKSEVECVRPIRADLVEVYGIISARIISNGKVVVKRGGSLRGAVNARGFIVDKGGEFYGDLSIGQTQLTQGELLIRSVKIRGRIKDLITAPVSVWHRHDPENLSAEPLSDIGRLHSSSTADR